MARSPEDRLVLSSRYIHTGNSGVTLTLRRDLERVNRAELEVENGAFGAFHTSLLIRGNDSEGMTSIQLRDLALMFLDAADSLDNEGRAVLKDDEGRPRDFVSILGKDRSDIVSDGGGARNHPPQSLKRYIPGELSGIALDPGVDLSKFASIHKDRTHNTTWCGSTDEDEKAVDRTKALPPAQRKFREQKLREERMESARRSHISSTGWDFLLAKRLFDLVTPFFEKTRSEFLVSETVKFDVPMRSEESSEDSDR